jgi:putative ABC transport system permease protein
MTSHRPPHLAERFVAATASDDEWSDSIVGDLREEYAVMIDRHGAWSARTWYWRHALAIGLRAITVRGKRRPAGGGWVSGADPSPRSGWWAGLGRDCRYAVRSVVRRAGTSAVIVVTLALALASNSTSLAIVDALVLRPFRFEGLERMLVVVSSDPQQFPLDRSSVAPADFRDWRRDARTVQWLSAAEWWDANLSGIENPEQVAGYRVTADFFTAIASPMTLGRSFTADEEVPGSHRRAVLGHALWQRLYASDPTVVGRTIRLDGEPYEVVGVAAPGFSLPDGAAIWAPLAKSVEGWNERKRADLTVVGRLADGATLADVRAELRALADRQREAYPETNRARLNGVLDFTTGMSDASAGPFVATIQAASLLLLSIACANIANLLLAVGAERAQEFALRLALGAGRGRLALQLLIEASIVSAIAIVVATPLTWGALELSHRSIPPSVVRFVPGMQYMAISPTVFAMTAAFGALATLAFALLPAWHATRPQLADTLRQAGRSTTAPRQRHWLRHVLAAGQVAMTLALLFGTVLMLSAVGRAVDGPVGFDKENLLIGRVVLPQRPYAEPERRRQFMESVLARLQAIPAVTVAAVTSNLPYGGANTGRELFPEGIDVPPADVRAVDYRRVTPAFFDALRIPLVGGRALNEGDASGSRAVAVVSRTLVERYWPDEDPVGRRFKLARDGAWITVVGVVGDVVQDWFQQRRRPTVYRPVAQDPPFAHAFVARTVGDPASLAGDLRRAVRASDPDQPILAVESMEDVVEDRTAGLVFIARSLAVVSAIALTLAIIGLYSLIAFTISRRTQELGVRMALGATRWQVVRLTTGQGCRITVAGLLLGLAGAFALGRLMESTLFGIVSISLWQLAALTAGIASVALLASYLPARRTARVDPMIALRSE